MLAEEKESCATVMARIEELSEAYEAALARIEQLEERLGLNSGNSDKPPSSDPPWDKVKRPGKHKKRRQGGQPGHRGHQRALIDAADVDRIEDVRPTTCAACATPLNGTDPAPRRHQVAELPKPKVIVTEYRVHRLTCRSCGHVTAGTLPDEAGRSAFGARAHATTAWLTGRLGVSKRQVVELYETLFGLRLSPASVCAMERRVADALAEPYAEAWSSARASPVVHVDETPWFQQRQLGYLWVMATQVATVFRIQERRDTEAAKAMLGPDFAGVACTDRLGAYRWIERRGLCLAHILRNMQRIAQRPGSEWYGTRLVATLRRVIAVWHGYDRGEETEVDMRAAVAEDRTRFERFLRAAAFRAPAEASQRQATDLLPEVDLLWTFLDVEGLTPTNNEAERAVRPAVLWRKRSGGTQSPAGSRFAERILTAIATLRHQQRDAVPFLHDAYVAHVNNEPSPSLVR